MVKKDLPEPVGATRPVNDASTAADTNGQGPRALWRRLRAVDWSVFAPNAAGVALALCVAAASAAWLAGGRGPAAVAESRLQLCAGVGAFSAESFLRFLVAAVGHLFVHVNWAHLVGNAAALACAASAVHRRLCAGGARPARAGLALCAFFLACGVAGGLTFAVSNFLSPACMIGASGAAAGLFGGALRSAFRAPDEVRTDPLGFAPLSAGVMALAFGLVALDWLGSTLAALLRLYPLAAASEAHAGGLLFGLIAFPRFVRLAGAR